MRPRWELKNSGNFYAAFIARKAVNVAGHHFYWLKLTDRLLTDMRDAGDTGDPIDNVVGFIIQPWSGKFGPAEVVEDEDIRFITYVNLDDPVWTPQQQQAYKEQLNAWGMAWKQQTQASQTVPANIEAMFNPPDFLENEEDDEPDRRGRGKPKRPRQT